MPKSLRQGFTKLSLPPVFQNHGMHSNFLINYWGDLISLISAFCLALITWIVTLILKAFGLFSALPILTQFKNIFKWNFLIILVASGIDYIVFCLSLSLHEVSFRSNSDKFGFCTCLLVLTITLVPIWLIFKHLILSLRSKSTIFVDDEPDFNKSQSKKQHYMQIVSQGIKQERASHPFFYIIYIFRLALPSIVASSLYTKPQAQAALYLLTSVLILAYLILAKPLVKKINQVQLIILESIILIIHICLLALTVLKIKSFEDTKATIVLGDTIIAGSYVVHAHAIIFLIIKLVLEIRNLYIPRKTQQKIPEMAWLQFIVIYIQQGAMGFEEITPELPSRAKVTPIAPTNALPTSNKALMPLKLSKNRMLKRSTMQTMTPKEIKQDGVSPMPSENAFEKFSDQYTSDNQVLEKDEYQPLGVKSDRLAMSSIICEQSLNNLDGTPQRTNGEECAFMFTPDDKDSMGHTVRKRVNLLRKLKSKSRFAKGWHDLDSNQRRPEILTGRTQQLSSSNVFLNYGSPKMDS